MNETNEAFTHQPSFDFRMNGKNVNPALCKPGKNFLPPLFHARFFKAGQIRWNLNQAGALMNEWRLCPRAAEILETEVANDGEDPIVDHPRRGAERGRSLSRQRFKSVDAAAEPFAYPLFRANGKLILPAPMIPCMKLRLVTFRQDPPNKLRKREGNLRRREKRSIQGGPETIETGGARPDHFLQKSGVFQDLQNRPPRGVRSDAQVKRGLEIHFPQQ